MHTGTHNQHETQTQTESVYNEMKCIWIYLALHKNMQTHTHVYILQQDVSVQLLIKEPP